MSLYDEIIAEKYEEYKYIDKWCAKNVRKVSFCNECLHFEECKKLGKSVSTKAIEHRENLPRGSILENWFKEK